MEREDRLGLPGDMADTLLKGLSLQVLATSGVPSADTPRHPSHCRRHWKLDPHCPLTLPWGLDKHNLPISREQVPGYEQEGSVLPWGGQRESAMQRREPEWE